MKKFQEYGRLNLPEVHKSILELWSREEVFEQTLKKNNGNTPFVFYEGPPSANGRPGIHHVVGRTIKDLFCRYKSMKSFYVARKAGWDTHGLPVELSVEKDLNITKEDIGKTISIADYNKACRKAVMKYTKQWEDLTRLMGYWADMSDPYITYESRYIESVWSLIKTLYDKGLIYKGYSVQPYSPVAGTGLSSHELNLPGCYRDVKDTTATVLFRMKQGEHTLFSGKDFPIYFMAWTTTPWTLPSNTGLVVGEKIEYSLIETVNPYTEKRINVILATALINKYFSEDNSSLPLKNYSKGDKSLPFRVKGRFLGKELEGLYYEQLLPFQQPKTGDAFKVLLGDFVTTENGTGIVHIAPAFGADDMRVGRQNNLGVLMLVDKQGKFIDGVGEFSGRYVKNEFDENANESDTSVDVDICLKLKKEGTLFKMEKYLHSYPHCWRTDKPILYYPLDSWFISTTDYKEEMIALNKTINWYPEHTGTGRFGNWLENLVDWNLSRSRYWGTPLPIWRTKDGAESTCIGSLEELKGEIDKSVIAGLMQSNPLANFTVGNFERSNYEQVDLHRPYVDDIVLVSSSGAPMYRESDLIDVWFDSGAMPFAQEHYPFEGEEGFAEKFPADFIAEGVDQTRGWFFTLHAIATMVKGDVAFKNIISNGLVLDKDGHKMSKRLGNGVDPFEMLNKYGSDAVRWYMVGNSNPWDNLKFHEEVIAEVTRRFFDTLHNTYGFFALYANVDDFDVNQPQVPHDRRSELDRWILSLLHSLVKRVTDALDTYDPTTAIKEMQSFMIDHVSNWFVRLSRQRYWRGEMNEDKLSAYQTLYECLLVLARLMAPIAPFYADRLYRDLYQGDKDCESVHLDTFPLPNEALVDKDLEGRMELAQSICSLTLSLRRKAKIKVRQPLSKIIVPVMDDVMKRQLIAVESIVKAEVNIKEIELVEDMQGVIKRSAKPNFKSLGPKYGKYMKDIAQLVGQFTADDILQLEKEGRYTLTIRGEKVQLESSDVEVLAEDIPGWMVASEGRVTVALDVQISEDLYEEGVARELINRIQNMRKDEGLEVTDQVLVSLYIPENLLKAVENFNSYISSQVLASDIVIGEKAEGTEHAINDMAVWIAIEKV